MVFSEVVERMNLFTLSAVRTSDLAISARKMMNWDKEAWSTSPCLATAANKPSLDENLLPLVHDLSNELSVTISLIFRKPELSDISEHGGMEFGHEKEFIPIEHIIGTQIILYNYCLLEAYEFDLYKKLLDKNKENFLDEKVSLKDILNRGSDKLLAGILEREQNKYERMGVRNRVNHWNKLGLEPIPEEWVKAYEDISNRRNTLTHEAHPDDVTLVEAIIIFHRTRLIARQLANHFNDDSISLCQSPLDDYPEI
ncbi:hypothetical protein [uncultured Psychrobacter sp.]|jgi:hypothetical protein|uniref:hypothetical protein n=1 Tax=uncultured Psychrobacter sp. TaxID=259303 RepID=UPI002597237C|nr:hypothetical protein [uncultured Psychrobacter sp.]